MTGAATPPPERVAFLGTPPIAVPFLRTVADSGVEIPLVVSRADARRGRRGSATPSPVKEAALQMGLTVTDDLDAVATAGADLAIVVAYGRLIPTRLLDAVPMVNVHFSLLPRWRGAAPVERAILAGDETTGVCLMDVAERLDEGDVYRRAEVPISESTTADALRAALADAGCRLLVDALADGLGSPEPQRGDPTYAEKLTTADLELDWQRSATELHRIVRVGGAWTTAGGKRLKVWDAVPDVTAGRSEAPGTLRGLTVSCGEGRLELREVQVEGKARADAGAWRSGARLADGTTLGG